MTMRVALAACGMAAFLFLTGCTTFGDSVVAPQLKGPDAADYAELKDGDFTIPAVPIEKVDQKYWRQEVRYPTKERPGTIIVDTPHRFLYYVEPGGKAMRYGIGVGKQGFAWEGEAYVAWKQPWPKWTPPKEMVARTPSLRKYGGDNGMPGGLKNPLGARAMYLFTPEGKDTLYRLHGTPEWKSIGHAMSSGCIRMMNQDVIDLYNRVTPSRYSKVIVLQADSEKGETAEDAES
ncbi:MAG: L,D-transpeptidase [Pararhizobium sp.]